VKKKSTTRFPTRKDLLNPDIFDLFKSSQNLSPIDSVVAKKKDAEVICFDQGYLLRS